MSPSSLHASTVPVGLPNVDGLWVRDAVLSCLVVQQVKEVFDSQRDRTTGAEDHGEQIVYKLLQRPLKNMAEEGESQYDLVRRYACYNAVIHTL